MSELNTFQTPNYVVDDLINHLDLNEIRVLMFIIRHDNGWFGYVNGEPPVMNLDTIRDGYTTDNGNVVNGVGMEDKPIEDALEMLFQSRIIIPSSYVWSLNTSSPIDLTPFFKRTEHRKKAYNRKRGEG